MRISDCSSDVCSSELSPSFLRSAGDPRSPVHHGSGWRRLFIALIAAWRPCPIGAGRGQGGLYALFFERFGLGSGQIGSQIGRASCRERVWRYVIILVGTVLLKKQKKNKNK